jgi:hypothetical protein
VKVGFLRGNKHTDVMEEIILKLSIWKMEGKEESIMLYLKQADGKSGFSFPVNFKRIHLVVLGYKT